jgi:hypothetical protein
MKNAMMVLLLWGVLCANALLVETEPTTLESKAVCTWDKWEGMVVSSYPFHHMMAFGNMSYNFADGKVYLEGFVVQQGRPDDIDINKWRFMTYFDFPHHILYVVGHDNTCTCHSLPSSMPEACIPKHAQSYGSSTIGVSLKVDTYHWLHKHEDEDRSLFFTAIMSHHENAPVSLYYHSKISTGSSQFFDITKGIENPDIFHRPPQCNCDDQLTSQVEDIPSIAHLLGLGFIQQ